MYKRIITAIAAVFIAIALLSTLGPFGASLSDPSLHTVARAE